LLHNLGQLIEELLWDHPFRFAIASARWRREVGRFVPVFGLHLSVELGERIDHDLAKQRLYRSLVFWRVILENARENSSQISGGTIHLGNSVGLFASPIRPNEKIETRLRPMLFSHVSKRIGTRVTELKCPEPVPEIGDLYDDRRGIEMLITYAINCV